MKVHSGDRKCRSETAIVVLDKRGSKWKKSGKQSYKKAQILVNCSEKFTVRKAV